MSSWPATGSTSTAAQGGPPTADARDRYLERVIQESKRRGRDWPAIVPASCTTKAYYDGRRYNWLDSLQPDETIVGGYRIVGEFDFQHMFNAISANETAGRYGVCVIQNITSSAVAYLGAAWDIDPLFFAENNRH
ncbi:Uu.00g005240.m01.CDS01 [Anthostomella pinea]|uniref:Uu.00g005240.m01.CDS01 n=1 Tax=Anthostomella pinea TaxID=933095 RepID=A0AAI8VK48_9PEZI|nr:Uu.00g005240.m01.CDS01 [Anthostomella pinea]